VFRQGMWIRPSRGRQRRSRQSELPYQAISTLEPMNCTAYVRRIAAKSGRDPEPGWCQGSGRTDYRTWLYRIVVHAPFVGVDSADSSGLCGRGRRDILAVQAPVSDLATGRRCDTIFRPGVHGMLQAA
jgi:hypothetical protein